MSNNRTPLTGKPLEEPNPPVPAIYLAHPVYRAQPCKEHNAPYSGRMPCTGVLRCTRCGTEWHPDTGKLLAVIRDGKRVSV